MNNKIMNVYYGDDLLPYKDEELQVHYPIVGNAFSGASDTTTIRFFVNNIGGVDNITWVAQSIRADGKKGYQVLTDKNSSLGYVALTLGSWYLNKIGDLRITLYGYEGGSELEVNETTGLIEVSGNPTVMPTGTLKINVAYSVQMDEDYGEVPSISVQQALALVGQKADTSWVNENFITKANGLEKITVDLLTEYGYTDYSVLANDFFDDFLYEDYNDKLILLHLDKTAIGYRGTWLGKVSKLSNGNYVYHFLKVSRDTTVASYLTVAKGTTTATSTLGSVFYSESTQYYQHTLVEKETLDNGLATKLDRKTTSMSVYGTASGVDQQVMIPYSNVPNSNSIAYRYVDGRLRVGTPVAANDATTKTYVDAFGKSLELSISSDYKLTAILKDKNGNVISTSNVIDLPLESIIVSAEYYNEYTYGGTTYEKVIVITLATTNVPTIIPVGDITQGLIDEDTLTETLEDYVKDVEITTIKTVSEVLEEIGGVNHIFSFDLMGIKYIGLFVNGANDDYDLELWNPSGTSKVSSIDTTQLFRTEIGNAVSELVYLPVVNLTQPITTLSNEEMITLSQNNSFIVYGGRVYVKANDTESGMEFVSAYYDDTVANGYHTENKYEITVSKTTKATNAITITNNYYDKSQTDTLLGGKQNTLTFDNTPTTNSSNPVTSGGIKDYVDTSIRESKQGHYVEVNTTTYPTLQDFLNSDGEEGIVYLYPLDTTDLSKGYYQYIWESNDWLPLGTTQLDLSNYVTLDTAQTISGAKTFSNGIKIGNTTISHGSDGNLIVELSGNNKSLRPSWNGHYNLGLSGYKWKDLYLSGSLYGSTYDITIDDLLSNIKGRYETADSYIKLNVINNYELNADTSLGFQSVPAGSNLTPEYKANFTNTGSSPITITFTDITHILCNDDNCVINGNAITLPAGVTIETSCVNHKMVAINFDVQ